jgi:hypothetical protein
MCAERVLLMWSTIAASVVDLPEPVLPVARTIPRGSSASSVTTEGRPSSSTVRKRDLAALQKDVDAKAGDAGDLVRDVDLVLLLELDETV